MSQLVFWICWNPKEVGSNANERQDVLTMGGQAGEEQALPSSMVLIQASSRRWDQIKVCLKVFSSLKIWIKGMLLSCLKIQITSVPFISGLKFLPVTVRLATKISNHIVSRNLPDLLSQSTLLTLVKFISSPPSLRL